MKQMGQIIQNMYIKYMYAIELSTVIVVSKVYVFVNYFRCVYRKDKYNCNITWLVKICK